MGEAGGLLDYPAAATDLRKAMERHFIKGVHRCWYEFIARSGSSCASCFECRVARGPKAGLDLICLGGHAMAYEYQVETGVLCLTKIRDRWVVQFNGVQHGNWRSSIAAAKAVSRQQSGLSDLDTGYLDIPADLLDWRPLGDSI